MLKLLEATATDPLRHGEDLPLAETFHPLGYAVKIQTNSEAILSAAADLWGPYPKLSCAEPVHVRVIVSEDSEGCERTPSPPRWNGHSFIIVHGPADFAIADLRAGLAVMHLSQRSTTDRAYLRYYFLEPLTYALQAAAHFVFVHASCISLANRAIVLCGDSGTGKTCLAYACAKRGWDFVSGDAVHIVRDAIGHDVGGRPLEIRFRSSAIGVFPELQMFPVEPRPNGKADIEIDTRKLTFPHTFRAAAHDIVFIERGSTMRMERKNRDQALRELQATICYGDQEILTQQRRALTRFVELPVWKLSYSNFDEADVALRALLQA